MAEPKTVTLLDKEGNEFHASHPGEVSTLVFGHGYRLKNKGQSVDEAMTLLAEKGVAAEAIAQTVPSSTKPDKQ